MKMLMRYLKVIEKKWKEKSSYEENGRVEVH